MVLNVEEIHVSGVGPDKVPITRVAAMPELVQAAIRSRMDEVLNGFFIFIFTLCLNLHWQKDSIINALLP